MRTSRAMRWLRSFRRAWSLESDTLKHVHHGELPKPESRSANDRRWRENPVACLGALLSRIALDLPSALRGSDPSAGSHVVLVATTNQRRALESLVPFLPNAALTEIPIFTRATVRGDHRFPMIRARLCGLLFIPKVARDGLRARGAQRASYWSHFDEYLEAHGTYVTAIGWLDRVAPLSIVLSNDHIPILRGLTRAARDAAVRVFYFQHASVNERFPPLAFDLSLLEGEDALETYRGIGAITGEVALVGMPRFDAHATHVNRSERLNKLGVCVNWLDPAKSVEALLSMLARDLPDLEVVLRPHPGDARKDDWRRMAERHGIVYSDARATPAFEFLASVDANLAGESSIHLEAAMMNVTPLYMDLGGKSMDFFGFRERGLVTAVDSLDELRATLITLQDARPDVRQRATHYNAVLGTRWEGRSSELAAMLIEATARGDVPDGTHVTTTPVGLRVYRPDPAESG